MIWISWIAFVTNVICVYLIVREVDINWPIGILGSITLVWVFWNLKLYAQVGLQIFYIIEGFYGWYKWTRRDHVTGIKLIRIGATKFQTALFLTVAGALGTAILYPIFHFTKDPAPWWDSVITIGSLIAEYMLCIKLFEAWIVYLLADLVSLVVLAWLGDWVTFGTYAVFTILCGMGVFAWRKTLRSSRQPLSLASSIP